ncbi:MAG TPA: hypothetical protein VMU13_03130 [Candidatus Paceibacterota bacterium]|nr:hypothetical protein [Candidatus Paceibacterota bacterium]
MITLEPSKRTTRENVQRISLMAAACFAIGAIALFVAVLMQRSAESAPQSLPQISTTQQIDQQKEALLQSLSATSAAHASTTGTAGATGKPNSAGATSAPTPTQSSEDAAKLKLLESLNSQ